MNSGRRLLLYVWPAFLVAIASGFVTAVFEEIPVGSGIDFAHENSPTSSKYLPETMGGGVALFDFDNDGDLDLFFTNGARLGDPMPSGQKPDKTDAKYRNRLFRNDGAWKFTDVTANSRIGR